MQSRFVSILLSISAVSLALPLVEVKPAPPLNAVDKAWSYALDMAPSSTLTVAQFQCFRQGGYATVFLRAYMPTGNGQVDPNGARNVLNANSAGLGVEIFVTPQASGSKTGAQQFDETYSAMTGAGVNLRSVWLQVTSPANWPQNTATNQNFILSFVNRAKTRSLTVGIYSNFYDWQQITANWNTLQNSAGQVNLWYWNVNGGGVSGETSADFSDYRAFGGWSQPSLKQFGQVETVCSITVNRDVYITGTKKQETHLKTDKPTIGGLFS